MEEGATAITSKLAEAGILLWLLVGELVCRNDHAGAAGIEFPRQQIVVMIRRRETAHAEKNAFDKDVLMPEVLSVQSQKTTRAKRWHWLLVLVCVLMVSAGVLAQEPENQKEPDEPATPKVSYFGRRFDAFQLILHDQGFELATLNDFSKQADASEWSLIVLGDSSIVEQLPGMDAFLAGGGTMLLAGKTQAKFTDAQRGSELEVIPIRQLTPPLANQFQNNRFLPIVRDFFPPTHPLFANVRSIVLNRPSLIQSDHTGFSVQAVMPIGTRSVPPVGLMSAKGPMVLVANDVNENQRDGRLVMISDHALFMNEMIMQEDNAILANNVAKWLARGNPNRKLLLIEYGSVVDELIDPRFESGEWPETELEQFVDLADRLMSKLDLGTIADGVINYIEQTARQAIPRFLIWLFTLGMLTYLLLCWAKRAGAIRRGSIDTANDRSQLLVNTIPNDMPPATRLAQLFFTRLDAKMQAMADRLHAGQAKPVSWHGYDEFVPAHGVAIPPPIVSRNFGWWNRRRLKKGWRDVYRIANGFKGADKVDVRSLARLLTRFERYLPADEPKV